MTLLDTWTPVLVALALATLVPFGTARLLAWALLRDLPVGGDERARRLSPFRRAAFVVGLAQLQLAWMAGAQALGPALVPEPGALPSLLFGAVTATIAFVAGGIARRVEDPPSDRSTVLGVATLRLRMVPYFAGPLLVAVAAASLPLVDAGPGGLHIHTGWLLLDLVLCALGVAFGGLALAVATSALRPASESVRTMAHEVAAREGVRLWLVLRLPTRGARFANAAALPWVRTMIVTDSAVELLSPEQLRAVLAHEAGHLSERPVVAVARVGAATLVFFTLTAGVRIATAMGGVAYSMLTGGILVAAVLFVTTLRLARRMEERADARAHETVGAVPLAEALRRLHAYAQAPFVTGRRRVHPDLYDRLVALGIDPGPRPPPPPRGGLVLGLVLAAALLGGPIALEAATEMAPATVRTASAGAAHARLAIEPWDGEAWLVLAWNARRRGDLDRAEEDATLASRAAVDPVAYYDTWTELSAARGDCASARHFFEEGLRAGAKRAFGHVLDRPLRLGGWELPPTFIKRCPVEASPAPPPANP